MSDGYWLALSLGPFSMLLPEYMKIKRGDVTHKVVADSIAAIVLHKKNIENGTMAKWAIISNEVS